MTNFAVPTSFSKEDYFKTLIINFNKQTDMKKLLLSLACMLGITAANAQVANIGELLTQASGTVTTVSADAVAVAQQGNNLWIKDNTGWILVYGSTGQTYENGDIIPGGYGGKFSPYNNLPELASPTDFGKAGNNGAVAPTVVTAANYSEQPLCSYIELRGAVTGSGRSYTLTDATGSAAIYTTSSSVTVATGDDVTVRGFVSIFKETYQISPVESIVNGGGEGGDDEEVAEVENIAAFIAKADAENVVKVKNDAIALGQLGNYLWITDGTGYILVYGSVGQTYENGDVISGGYSGKYVNYQNLIELGSPAGFAASTSNVGPMEPAVVFVADANAEPLNSYIEMRGVTITATSNARTFTCSDASGEINLYTANSSFTVPTGDNYTVRGFVSIYGSTYQITPIEIVSSSGRETVATPTFSVHEGPVPAGTLVEIACATEGATIYYTLDGTNPNADSSVYSAPIEINEDVTITALAVCDGYDDSAINSASYTVIVTGDNVAMFNFTDPSSLSPAYNNDPVEGGADVDSTTNYKYDVEDVTFSVGEITVTGTLADGQTGGTGSRLYWSSTSGAWTFRVYNKHAIAVAVDENVKENSILSVTFDFANKGTSAKSVAAPAVGTWDSATYTWQASDDNGVKSVVFNLSGTVQVNGINVVAKGDLSGVENIAIENDENAPVEYFNLQGVRIANPENGLYIRRQGNNVSKVLIR